MHMDAGLDTGAVIAEQRTPILPDDTGQSLHDRLAGLGADLICRVLPDWLAGRISAVPQPVEGVTYARKLTKEDGRLDWAQSASALDRKIRALNPWPGAFTTLPTGTGTVELLKIWEAQPAAVPATGPTWAVPGEVRVAQGDELMVAVGSVGEGLRIHSLQREGRRRMTAREFLAGAGLKPGLRLGV
jgi:methionyl-tRNA formyltransferase